MKIPKTLIELVKFRINFNNIDSFVENDFINALELSLKAFNMYPIITYFKWEDIETIDMISDLLVTYATVILLQKRFINQSNKDFKINDSGISFIPQKNSDMEINLLMNFYDNWYNQISILKSSKSFIEDFVKEDD